ncbi:MAG TPA: dTDP-4-dehydrorhamnose 3,5-epimerase [Candidatus Tumulicola sp.]|jgi:dTDP-4-dehydrorhamnose 3,5-epimerase|nr:dTDP-4-dehydrorhamnose 3,5-epimerase [Candidatus Tumulicola sp.]
MIVVKPTKFADAHLFVPDVFSDARGYFKETYARRKYEELGIADEWVQDAVSRSRKNVLRGMHYDMRMAKLAQVLVGRAYDVIVDVREGSPTYKQWQGFDLSGDNHMQVYVPKGFAHGFLALSDEVIFHYKMSAHFDPQHERVLSWKDPSVGIEWPIEGEPLLSPKDAAA